MSKNKRVVILGGGFAGLRAARALAKAPVDVVLIDRTNHHLFQPLLYQVATAALSPRDIGQPLRGVLRRQENASVLMAEVVGFAPEEQRVVFADGDSIEYDILVVALGARHSYFGHDDWERNAPGLKTLHDALELRRRILLEFERAEGLAARLARAGGENSASRLSPPRFLIVGAGPTGVEMAGAISEIARRTMLRDFRYIRPESTEVLLVEAGPRVLPPFPEELSVKAQRQLESLGVKVMVGTRVAAVEEHSVRLEKNVAGVAGATSEIEVEELAVNCIIWAAGNQVSEILSGLPADRDRSGRLMVQPDLSLARDSKIFVIGDAAHCLGKDGKPLPGLAPVASQQGEAVAENIVRDLQGKPRHDFSYRDRGSMATIGKARAVAWIGKLRFGGFLAWAAWCVVHILSLIGFRNRIIVVLEWIYLYLLNRRAARLVDGWPPTPRSRDGAT